MKRILLIFISLITTLTLWAGNVITYTASQKLRESTYSYGIEGMYIAAFNVSISSHTFSNGTGKITFSGELTTIGYEAFYKCSSLTSITIPNSVTIIGKDAFYNCSGLTSITIPNSVLSIDDEAFRGCTSLASATIGNSVTIIGQYAFRDCSALTSITIPNSVISIGWGAFEYCTGITSATIGNSVTSIDEYAFSDCTNLTSVTIGTSVTSIGKYAFAECTNINSVHISDLAAWCEISFGDIFSNPLYYSHQLYFNGELVTNLTIPSSVTNIGKYAFYGCSDLTSVTIPNSVTSIGTEAFYKCSGLTSVLIPNSVEDIDYLAFWGCTGLTSVEINSQGVVGKSYPSSMLVKSVNDIFGPQVQIYVVGNSVTSIGDYAFKDCIGLTSVTIGNSVISIGKMIFTGCTNLASVTIPVSVTSINSSFISTPSITSLSVASGNRTFDSRNNCNAIIETSSNTLIAGCKNTIIPSSVTSIGKDAFYSCKNLSSITVPNSVTSIGEYAFANCSGLTSFTIPNSVASIGDYAFINCTNLTSIAIPDSVTSIGDYVFRGCSGITSIVWNPKNCSVSVFESALPFYEIRGQITSFVFGDEVESIPAYLCCGMKKLTSIIIPSTVSIIGGQTFSGCSGLKTITCAATTPPTCYIYCFSSVKKDIPLYVPQSSVASYQTAKEWKEFTNILSMPDEHSAIDTQSAPSQPTKILRNGRIIIRKNNTEYDILGR